MDLSVILPVYNSGPSLLERVADLQAYLGQRFTRFEIIVVDDGSDVVTASTVRAARCGNVRALRLATNQGKFGAIAAGMAAATGRCRIFTDADIPYDLAAIPYIEAIIRCGGFDLVIGDRTLPESVYAEGVPWGRRIVSKLFRFGVRIANVGEVFDTQCGIKGFRGEIADELFPLLRYHRFAGDIELLYIALKYNLAIRRIPVRLQHRGASTVRLFSAAPEFVRCCLSLRRNWLRGEYQSSMLESFGAQRYWESGSNGLTEEAERAVERKRRRG